MDDKLYHTIFTLLRRVAAVALFKTAISKSTNIALANIPDATTLYMLA